MKPDKFSVPPNNLRTYAPDYGTISQVYNGIDINLNARMRNGVQLQAGTSTGQRVTDYCDVRSKLPEQTGGFSTGSEVQAYSPVNPYCHVEPGITTRFTGAGSYIVPKIDVQLAARSRARRPSRCRRTGRCRAPIVAQTLGRPLSGSAPNVTVNLLAPDQMRGPRVNQLDLRVGKVLRFGNQRAHGVGGHVQRAQRRHGADLQPGVHARRRVARADDGADGAHGEDHRAVPTSRQA